MEILREEEGFQFGFKRWQGWAVSKVLWEWIPNVGSGQSKRQLRIVCWSLLYSTVLRSRADSLRSHVIRHEWLAFYSAFLNIYRNGVLTTLTWLVPHETAAVPFVVFVYFVEKYCVILLTSNSKITQRSPPSPPPPTPSTNWQHSEKYCQPPWKYSVCGGGGGGGVKHCFSVLKQEVRPLFRFSGSPQFAFWGEALQTRHLSHLHSKAMSQPQDQPRFQSR